MKPFTNTSERRSERNRRPVVAAIASGAIAAALVFGGAGQATAKGKKSKTQPAETTSSQTSAEPTTYEKSDTYAADVGKAVYVSEEGATDCDQTGITQRFAGWGDYRHYVPVAGGTFEDGAPGWELSKNAFVDGDGNPDGTDGHSLRLASGSSATSPPICVHLDYTVARAFAKKEKGKSDTTLGVDVTYVDPSKDPADAVKAKSAELAPGDRWNATDEWKMPDPYKLGILHDTKDEFGTKYIVDGGAALVQFHFSAPAGTEWKIDDVFVDPRMRR